MKLTQDQVFLILCDLHKIAEWFNKARQHNNAFISANGLSSTSKELDLYYLTVGGAELGKQFSKDWQLAIKIAMQKKELQALQYVEDINQSGHDAVLFGEELEEKTRAYQYIPGVSIPNKWTGNKYSQCKANLTLLISVGCNADGTIKKMWAVIVALTGNPDGKSGDWKYSAASNDNAFSSFTLEREVTTRPSYVQIMGQVEPDFGVRGEAKKGMKIVLEECKTI